MATLRDDLTTAANTILATTASQETFFDFELTKGYTFKASVEQGGDGVMYFWNNKVFPMHGPNHYLQFLDASKNLIDV